MNKALERIAEYTNEILVIPVPTQESNKQAGVPKNIVSDPEQFDGNKIKFEDQ